MLRSRDRAPKLVVKLGCGAALRLASNLSPHGFGHGRDVRQPLRQRAEIKPGAADENSGPFADVRQNLARAKRPPAGRKIDRAVDHAEQAMRREPLLVRRRPRGQDSQVPVDLHRIGVDDRRAERSASASAAADLPLAVGPAMRSARLKCWPARLEASCRPSSSPRSSPIHRRRRSAKQQSTAPRKPSMGSSAGAGSTRASPPILFSPGT